MGLSHLVLQLTQTGKNKGKSIRNTVLFIIAQRFLKALYCALKFILVSVHQSHSLIEVSCPKLVIVGLADILGPAESHEGPGEITLISRQLSQSLHQVSNIFLVPLFFKEIKGLFIMSAGGLRVLGVPVNISETDGG